MSAARPARRRWRPPWTPRDLPVVAAIAAIQVVGTTLAARGQPARTGLDALTYVLLLAGPAALLAWRRRPLPVLAAVVAITAAYLLLGYPYGPFALSAVAALVVAVVRGRRVAAWVAAGVLYGVHAAALGLLDRFPGAEPGALVGTAAWLLVVLVAAELVRSRREHRREEERARAAQLERRAGEERLHVARELHDLLGHSLSLISVQAGVALHLIDERPEQARTALAAIKETSKEALDEVRAVLGVLRRDGEAAPRAPSSGLARLDELAARARAGGLEVRVERSGAVRPLPAGVDAAAFRIAQEALTNVARHAGAARATVRVAYGPRELTLEVEDDGRGAPAGGAPEGASGIPGMRERAAALGGELLAAPRAGGGFRVRARLPLPVAPEPRVGAA
jgi:signal transduction histidine kinase